jgi:hypothetical protein
VVWIESKFDKLLTSIVDFMTGVLLIMDQDILYNVEKKNPKLVPISLATKVHLRLELDVEEDNYLEKRKLGYVIEVSLSYFQHCLRRCVKQLAKPAQPSNSDFGSDGPPFSKVCAPTDKSRVFLERRILA